MSKKKPEAKQSSSKIIIILSVALLIVTAASIVLGVMQTRSTNSNGNITSQTDAVRLGVSAADILAPGFVPDENWVYDESAGVYNSQYIREPNYINDYYIVVYVKTQNIVVYGKNTDGGYSVPVMCFYCSSGTTADPTKAGLYSITKQFRWKELMGGVYGQYSSLFSKGYLFHSVPYSTDDPSTLNENSFKKLGERASHGCVRLCVRDVKWIYDNCDIGTQVLVIYEEKPENIEPIPIPELNDDPIYDGWDPTDLTPYNPYVKYAEEQQEE